MPSAKRKQYAYWDQENEVFMYFDELHECVSECPLEEVEVYEFTPKLLGKYQLQQKAVRIRPRRKSK